MARKSRDEGGGGESWMNTYADMVTLLLTFFIMLFGMSSMNEDKWQKLVQSFTNQTGDETNQIVITPEGDGTSIGANQAASPVTPLESGEAGAPGEPNELPIDFEELFQYLKAYVSENKMESSVSVEKGEGGETIFIRIKNNIFFNPDSFSLKKDSIAILDFLGDGFKSVEDQIFLIKVNGHTANIPNYSVNDRMLSVQRAATVAIYFQDEKKIDPTKLLPDGYGNTVPIADNSTEAGREQNRRVDIMVISQASAPDTNNPFVQALMGASEKEIGAYPPQSGTAQEILVPGSSIKEAEAAKAAAAAAAASPPAPAPPAPAVEPASAPAAPPAK